MKNIVGIPTTRVSNLLVYQRVLQQVQYDQKELYRLQNQLSTGRRFELPGEDPIAALRVMGLQSLLERKEQVRTNLATSQSYLTATDTAMSRISELMAEVRGVAVGAIDTVVTEDQRLAAIQQVEQAIRQLTDAGNQKFRGRYLFAGSTTLVLPFQEGPGEAIEYCGNEENLLSYTDVDMLFPTNMTGSQVFGAISEPVRGTADLNPILAYDTRLADLNGGEGISLGSIAISDGTHTSIVDVSTAETLGDVAALIRAHPPETRSLDAEITATGLVLQLDPASGNFSIREVGGGTTAYELGILTETGVGSSPIVGEDLDPILRATTPLGHILGARARAVVRFVGPDNDLILEAATRGTDLNGVSITFVDDPSVTAGNEVVTYDAGLKTLEIRIEENLTRAYHVVDAVNGAHAGGDVPFTARLDPLDEQQGGQGLVHATTPSQTAGGSEIEFDRDSGLQIVVGDETYTISLATAETIEDLLNLLNGCGAGLLAEINEGATGIDVRSRLSGVDFSIGENGGTTATELGLRTFTPETRLEELNFGRGVAEYEGSGHEASALYESGGEHNDLIIRARGTGVAWNDFAVDFVDSGGAPGSETISYDPTAKTIAFEIVPGSTTANDLIDLASLTPGLDADFEIELVRDDGSPNDGTGLVQLGSVTTAGGYRDDFQITRADGVTFEVDLSGAETIGEVIYRIKAHPDNTLLPNGEPALVARLATIGNGIELVDDSIGPGSLTVAKTGLSRAAVDLGILPEGQTSRTATDLGAPATAVWDDGSSADNELRITASSASSYYNGVVLNVHDDGNGVGNVPVLSYDPVNKILDIEIENGMTTANDVITELSSTPPVAALFTLSTEGSSSGTGTLTDADPAWQSVGLSGGGPQSLTGADVHPHETEGLFTALLRLRDGLQANDLGTVERAVEMLDAQVLQMNLSRAEVGAKQQGLDVLQLRLDSEEIQLREALSVAYDVDIAEVISNLTARQLALEATLVSTARIFEMSLLNYL